MREILATDFKFFEKYRRLNKRNQLMIPATWEDKTMNRPVSNGVSVIFNVVGTDEEFEELIKWNKLTAKEEQRYPFGMEERLMRNIIPNESDYKDFELDDTELYLKATDGMVKLFYENKDGYCGVQYDEYKFIDETVDAFRIYRSGKFFVIAKWDVDTEEKEYTLKAMIAMHRSGFDACIGNQYIVPFNTPQEEEEEEIIHKTYPVEHETTNED